MLLEASRLVEEGIVADVRDVDLAMIFGTGFPPFKGGLFFWADAMGLDTISKKLGELESLGERFRTPESLAELAKAGKTFYDIT